MMFNDEYRKQIDKIKADESKKTEILEKLVHRKTEKKRNNILIYRTAAAIAACIAIVISVWAVNFGKIPTKNNVDNVSSVSGVTNQSINKPQVTYNDVYNTVKEFIPKKGSNFKNFITNGTGALKGSRDEMEIVEEYVTEDIAIDESAVEDNMAMPGATNGNSSSTAVSTDKTSNKSDKNYSETTSQVEGVHEADIVKTDGEYIYSLSFKTESLRIIKAGREPKVVGSLKLSEKGMGFTEQMYLVDKKIVLLGNKYEDDGIVTATVKIFDVSNPESIKELFKCEQSGYITDSRMIGEKLYLISNYSLEVENIKEKNPATYVPVICCEDYENVVSEDCIYINENVQSAQYTVICAYSAMDGSLLGTQSVLGGTYTVYCNTKNIITAGYSKDDKTNITRYSLNDGKIEFIASGEIKGSLLNQFSIDEFDGNFRFVTTLSKGIETKHDKYVSYKIENINALYILNSELKQIGAIENLAPDERVYSVRFMGEIAYFVTFRQVDPLFSADLSDPNNPKIIGKLKIPGFSSYMFPYGEGKLLGIGQDADEKTGRTNGVKLSMFDINDPANVTESAKLILDSNYSDSLHNHKAIIVDYKRNIIGFSVYVDDGSEYRMFKFENGEFIELAKLDLGYSSDTRGLYIGNEFYVVSNDSVSVYDMTDYSLISKLELKV